MPNNSPLVNIKQLDAPYGTAGGDLTGTYPNPSIVAGSLSAEDFQLASVFGEPIKDNCVLPGHTNIFSGLSNIRMLLTTTSQSRANSTMIKDNFFFFPAGANEVYSVFGYAAGTYANGGWRLTFDGPSGATGIFGGLESDATNGAIVGNQAQGLGTTLSFTGQAGSTGFWTQFWGYFVNGGTPGIIGMRWASNNASVTVLNSGSYLMVKRIA